MTEKQNRILRLVMSAILLVSMFITAREGAVYVSSTGAVTEKQEEDRPEGQKEQICIVVDAGHGSGNLRKVTKG